MYWWLLVEFICIYCGSVDNMQLIKRGGLPNADPSPGNPRFQAASKFCVVDSKCSGHRTGPKVISALST